MRKSILSILFVCLFLISSCTTQPLPAAPINSPLPVTPTNYAFHSQTPTQKPTSLPELTIEDVGLIWNPNEQSNMEILPCYRFTSTEFNAGDFVFFQKKEENAPYTVYAPADGKIVEANYINDSVGWDITVRTPYTLDGYPVYYDIIQSSGLFPGLGVGRFIHKGDALAFIDPEEISMADHEWQIDIGFRNGKEQANPDLPGWIGLGYFSYTSLILDDLEMLDESKYKIRSACDADPLQQTKSFITPTPGGFTYEIKTIGPIAVPADPEKGFNWPYLLFVPAKVSGGHILVVPNNSGSKDNDFSFHENRAKDAMSYKIPWAEELEVPLLVPIFPRFDDDSDGTMASQYLGRGSLEKYWRNGYPEIAREDLQLIAMIDDARERLGSLGIEVDEKVFIEGYSASAMFTSRFTILHPDRVQASAFGGHGWAIVPTDKWENLSLPYPYGTADIQTLTGQPFNIEEFKRVPIFSYMGELDNNGWALPWYMGAGYNPGGYYPRFKAIFGSSAREMSDSATQVYQSLGCNATFVVYQNQDHQSAYSHEKEVMDFFDRNK